MHGLIDQPNEPLRRRSNHPRARRWPILDVSRARWPFVALTISIALMLTLPAQAADEALAKVPPETSRTNAPVLTNAHQIVSFSLADARHSPPPASFSGVATYVIPPTGWIYAQDDSGGVLIVTTNRGIDIVPGQRLTAHGIAKAGQFAVHLMQAVVEPGPIGPLPPAPEADARRLSNGESFGEWVSLKGRVIGMSYLEGYLWLVLSSDHVICRALISQPKWDPAFRSLYDALIELKGVVWTETDMLNRPAGFRLHVISTNMMQVIATAPANPFVRPFISAADLRRQPDSDGRVHFQATVTHHSPGRWLYLYDELGTIRATPYLPYIGNVVTSPFVERPNLDVLMPGDLVDVVASPTGPRSSPRLVEAEFRKYGHKEAPLTATVHHANELLTGQFEGRLVTLRARVLDRQDKPYDGGTETRFLLQDRDATFQAIIESSRTNSMSALPDNALIELTGICDTENADWREARTFQLLVARSSDVRVIGQAPWWYGWPWGRIGATSGALLCAGFVWIHLLRRQVRQRTAELVVANDQLRQNAARLHESETLFRTVFDASPAMVSLVRLADERMINANEALCRKSEYPREAILGRTLSELGFWSSPAQRETFVQELRSHGRIRDQEIVLHSRTGRLDTLLLSADIIEVNGEPHILTAAVDISMRKQVEEESRRTLAQERELSRLKTQFVTTISHEFRTPLGVIMSSAENLRDYHDRFSAEQRSSHLRDIFEATRTMSGLMEEVLLLGRVEAGKVPYRPATIDVPTLCAKLREEVRTSTDERCPIELRVGPIDRSALGDEGLLRHILVNLLTNGVKYSPPGRPVELHFEQRESIGVFTVRDRGVGIPPEDAPHLFDAFHRGRNVGDVPGSGLGMVIVRRCVDLHGGSIDFDSRVGEGSTFYVRLPLFVPVS